MLSGDADSFGAQLNDQPPVVGQPILEWAVTVQAVTVQAAEKRGFGLVPEYHLGANRGDELTEARHAERLNHGGRRQVDGQAQRSLVRGPRDRESRTAHWLGRQR